MSKNKSRKPRQNNYSRTDNMPEDSIGAGVVEEIPENLPAENTKVTKKSGGLGVFVSMLLSIAALAGGGALYLSLNSQKEQLTTRIDSLEFSLSSVSTELADSQKKLSQTKQRYATESQSIKKSIAKIYTRVENTTQSWSIEEVGQLLQLAVDQLSLAGNIDSALTALKIADRRIADGGNAELQTVRTQIAQDIASLQQIERIDLAGTVNRLRAVELAITKLPVVQQPVMEKNDKSSIEADKTNDTDSTANLWQQMIQEMSGLVRIRRIDHDEAPLLPPEQSYYLRENTKSLIMGARLALLRNDSKTYQNSLLQAQQWLAKYYDNNQQSTQWLLGELKTLSSLNPTPQLPDISGSLISLHKATTGSSEGSSVGNSD